MRTAPKGKWFIRARETESGFEFYPFYDGFNTKKEAQKVCKKLNKATQKVIHEVVRREV